MRETIYIGFKVKYKPYFSVRLGPGFSLRLDFLLNTIRSFLIIDVVTAVTSTVVALSLIVLSLVIKTAGFAPKWSPKRFL